MLCIIDFGMGNLRSINRKLRSVGISSEISSADMLILPGVLINYPSKTDLDILFERLGDYRL